MLSSSTLVDLDLLQEIRRDTLTKKDQKQLYSQNPQTKQGV